METAVEGISIEGLVNWRKPREVMTKNGPRILRTAIPTEQFWAAWRDSKEQLQAAGVSVSMPNQWNPEHEACWWQELPREELEKREASLQGSRAVDASIILPKPDGCEYMGFQKAGIRYALDCFARGTGCFIGDEMGLGKTIQAIGLLNTLPDVSRVLIVCPLTLKLNWFAELKKWLVRPLSIGIADAQCFPTTDIVILHYDVAHKWPKKMEFMWDMVIMDECHRCKSRGARRTRSLLGFRPTRREAERGEQSTSGVPAKRKLLLSGTPFENRPAELFPLVSYIAPEVFKSRWSFEKRYCGASFNGFGYEAKGAANLDELQKKLRENCFVRRLKADVLTDLPPKTRSVVLLPKSGCEGAVAEEQRVWREQEVELEKAQAEYEVAKAEDSEDSFQAAVGRLKKAAATAFSEVAKVRHATALAKLPQCVELLKEEVEQCGKVVCFVHHHDVGYRLREEFGKDCVLVTGETPPDERQAAVQRFQKDPSLKLFIGSIRATGEGITLTAASHVVFVECDWVPGKLSQCEDRLHRIGQRECVTVKHFILEGSIDARMIQTCVEKQGVIDKALDEQVRKDLIAEPVIFPTHKPLATRRELEVEATIVTPEQEEAVLRGLRILAARCDGARELDGAGFSKIDSDIGKSLASRPFLTGRQVVLGRKLCVRHRRQLPEDVVSAMGGWQGAGNR